jgi:cobalt/nickel transport system ATP-binding protein
MKKTKKDEHQHAQGEHTQEQKSHILTADQPKEHLGHKEGHEPHHPGHEEEIVRVSCIKHVFEDKSAIHICGLDFTVMKGERVAILGPSGSGKTTLLKHLLGLLEPQEGHVEVFGMSPIADYKKIRTRIGFVTQNVDEQIIAPTVYEDICFTPLNFGYTKEETEKMADEIVGRLGIGYLKDRAPHYLSGGEKRKVALAGALVLKPELLVLDEPFAGLDLYSRNDFISIINDFNRDFGTAVVLTTHDVDIMPEITDSIYLLKFGGEISKKGSPAEIFGNPKELEKYKIEAPILSKLFFKLKKYFPEIKIPATIEEAEKYIKEELK